MSRPYAAKLQELLQASYNLPNAFCELGRIELGPAELAEATCCLYKHDKAGIDAKAHYLLAASGFNAEQVLHDIELLKTAKKEPFKQHTTAPTSTPPPSTTANGSTVKQSSKQADPIVTASVQVFDSFLEKHINKSQIKTLIAPPKPESAEQQPQTANPLTQPVVPMELTPIMRAYSSVVSELCDEGFKTPALYSKFAAAARKSQASTVVIDCWNALGAESATKFLEQQFEEVMDSEIAARRSGAKLGGVPTPFNKVQAFVSLKHCHNGTWDDSLTLVNKTPIWAYLYYLLRSGHSQAALQLVLERRDIFESAGSAFAAHFQAWIAANGKLNPTVLARISAEYRMLFRKGVKFDPYKQILYKTIGRCDLATKTSPVAQTTEDWLWLQLQLVEPNSPYTFENLQETVQGIGLDPFEPHQYCAILILLNLVPAALNILHEKDEVLGVHMAICLAARNSLPKVCDKTFAESVERYTCLFRNASPCLAVDYLSTLALAANSASDVCKALQRLVLSTRHFSELVGDRTAFSNEIVPASIEKRMPLITASFSTENQVESVNGSSNEKHALFLDHITRPAARSALEAGNIVDAVLLFRLAGDYSLVFDIINQQLGVLLAGAQPGADTGLENDEMVILTRNLLLADRESPVAAVPNRAVCEHLLDVAACFKFYAKKEYLLCIDRISATNLVPLGVSNTEPFALGDLFSILDSNLRKCVPNLLIMAMSSIVELSAKRPDILYKQRANACMVYAGLIQLRMPREVFHQLTELDAKI